MAARAVQRNVRAERIDDAWRASFFAMGSPCDVLSEACSRDDAIALGRVAAAEAWRIEDKFSRYREGNIVDRINSARGLKVTVDDETARLIDFSAELYNMSDGRFDITSGVLRKVWTFDGSDNVPDAQEVKDILELLGWEKLEWHDNSIVMPAGMEIDFGGVGKEYAVNRAAALVRECTGTSCLVNFGGDLAVSRTPAKRPAWQVGIDSGTLTAEASKIISLQTGALATSGDSRRFLFKDGVRYCHIIDPTTGWPIVGAPVSVTVAADTCVQAGMISTLAMLSGAGAETFLAAQDLKSWCSR